MILGGGLVLCFMGEGLQIRSFTHSLQFYNHFYYIVNTSRQLFAACDSKLPLYLTVVMQLSRPCGQPSKVS